MVMVPTDVTMFILDLLALKFFFVSISIAAEKIQGLADEVSGQALALAFEVLLESSNSEMLCCPQECLEHQQPLIAIVQTMLFADVDEFISLVLV
jgi:hypothetical protein